MEFLPAIVRTPAAATITLRLGCSGYRTLPCTNRVKGSCDSFNEYERNERGMKQVRPKSITQSLPDSSTRKLAAFKSDGHKIKSSRASLSN
jgi:hypothetical protein